MIDKSPNVTPTPAILQRQIRALASDSANVFFSRHAEERMVQQGITALDALRVLRFGEISGGIRQGTAAGEWTCKLVARKPRSRDVGVVTVVQQASRLFVKTVEWEDR
jgi:hypothetical protein